MTWNMERKSRKTSAAVSLLAAAGILGAGDAAATLILDTSITADFATTSTGTTGNDLPGAPSQVYFGQLEASANGSVDFFYVGNEAGYVNTLWMGGDSHSAYADTFSQPYNSVGSIDVTAGSLLDFGFCTNGGDWVAPSGRCAWNNDESSLISQFNYGGVGSGYRSIAYVALSDFDSQSGQWTYANPLNGSFSDLWMILWDDSGAKNDDNHDDYVAIARFLPATQVSEPASLALFVFGLLAVFALRRPRNSSIRLP